MSITHLVLTEPRKSFTTLHVTIAADGGGNRVGIDGGDSQLLKGEGHCAIEVEEGGVGA